MSLLSKLFGRFLRSWTESEKDDFIHRFLRTLTDKEKRELENELDSKSADEIAAELLADDDDVVDEVEESNNSEVR